jgi:hypothetical protein
MSKPDSITQDALARCVAAMSKPAPRDALALIASGRVTVEVRSDGDCYLDTLNGKRVRDPGHPDMMMPIAGAWPLFRAGMIDQFGVVTDAGRALLAEIKNAV